MLLNVSYAGAVQYMIDVDGHYSYCIESGSWVVWVCMFDRRWEGHGREVGMDDAGTVCMYYVHVYVGICMGMGNIIIRREERRMSE